MLRKGAPSRRVCLRWQSPSINRRQIAHYHTTMAMAMEWVVSGHSLPHFNYFFFSPLSHSLSLVLFPSNVILLHPYLTVSDLFLFISLPHRLKKTNTDRRTRLSPIFVIEVVVNHVTWFYQLNSFSPFFFTLGDQQLVRILFIFYDGRCLRERSPFIIVNDFTNVQQKRQKMAADFTRKWRHSFPSLPGA